MDYGKAKWKKTREYILKIDGYKDQVATMFGKTEEATIVHHIYPVTNYPEWKWESWNLISVSKATHNKLENRRTGELTALGKWLQEIIPPKKIWRKRK